MPSLSWKRYLEKASRAYHEQLLEANRDDSLPVGARNYFREHAIDPRIALKYRLGFVGKPLPGDERFVNMISIPYLTPSGVMSLKFRAWAPGGFKYAKHTGDGNRIYNSGIYFDAGEILGIAEGEMDAIAATEHLGVPCIGVPGVEAWKDHWKSIPKDFTTVFIFGDGDEAGRKYALEMADMVGWRGRIVQCPEGEDVSSMAAVGRAAELSALVTTSNGEEE